ncbi:MAG: tetratricopeptide repeat protein [Lautropia sp.]|nr:tetratricopeptide repeat protein [Lautropia sp.]
MARSLTLTLALAGFVSFGQRALADIHTQTNAPAAGTAIQSLPVSTALQQAVRSRHGQRHEPRPAYAIDRSITASALTETESHPFATDRPARPETLPPAGSFSALPALLNQARALLPYDPQTAYELLEPHTWDYAGSRDFDYLLGLAALESKRPGEAVTALERVLMQYPDDIPARTDIVRAYLMLKEHQTAEQELRQLMDTPGLPDETQRSIQRYLDIIARRNDQQNRRWRLGVDLGTGHDDNVNVGSSQSVWLIDDGKALTPLPGSQPQGSPFLDLGGHFHYLYPLSEQLEWSTTLTANQRINSRQHPQDPGVLGLSSGLALTRGAHRLSSALNLQQMLLDQKRFRRASGLMLQWQYQRSRQTQIGAYAQHFLLDFNHQPIRDARRSVAGATLAHALEKPAGRVLIVNPYLGREHTRYDLPTLSFALAGLRLGYQHDLGNQWRGSLGLQWEERRHRGPDPLFGIRRHDRQLDLRLGAERPLGKHLSLSPQLSFSRNHSTLAPNDFRRTQLSVNLQYRY